jgi:hypothetical protein
VTSKTVLGLIYGEHILFLKELKLVHKFAAGFKTIVRNNPAKRKEVNMLNKSLKHAFSLPENENHVLQLFKLQSFSSVL